MSENDGQGMIVNPVSDDDNQDWDGDEADRADRLRFAEEQAMIKEQSEHRQDDSLRRAQQQADEESGEAK
ncbi:hypothetical protein C6401_12330 [Arthrobacter woluwensis]|uniref:hypothetical protein n=1 Tax=Arthrobacter woluwensis TaxID=156980 RepID=UPI000D1345E5|nr:hypothetical protein [Arthrobacter woluwensis]PSS43394.1 hypothetical protein C6401_12330 [Arthrobacter woluwensis]